MGKHVLFFVFVGGFGGYYGRGKTLREAEKNCRRAAGRSWGVCKKERLARFMASSTEPFDDPNVKCYVNDSGHLSYTRETVTVRDLDASPTGCCPPANKYIWYDEVNGVRRLTGVCCCDLCWECEWEPRLSFLEAHTNVPEGATYRFNGAVGTGQETAEKVFEEWGEATSTSLEYWLRMTCALRPGDSFAADEPWSGEALVTRLT